MNFEERFLAAWAVATPRPWATLPEELSVFQLPGGGVIFWPDDEYPRDDNKPRQNIDAVVLTANAVEKIAEVIAWARNQDCEADGCFRCGKLRALLESLDNLQT